MHSMNAVTGRMLCCSGTTLLRHMEDFQKNMTHDLVRIGSGGGESDKGDASISLQEP